MSSSASNSSLGARLMDVWSYLTRGGFGSFWDDVVMHRDRSSYQTRLFRVHMLKASVNRIRAVLVMVLLMLFFMAPKDFLFFDSSAISYALFYWRLVTFALVGLVLALITVWDLHRHVNYLVMGLYLTDFILMGYMFGRVAGFDFPWYYVAYVFPMFTVVMSVDIVRRFVSCLLLTVSYAVTYTWTYASVNPVAFEAYPYLDQHISLMAVSSVLCTVIGHVIYHFDYLNFFKEREIRRKQTQLDQEREVAERERERSEKLLRNILPEEVAHRLKNRDELIAEGYTEATVLFADIVDFTPLADKLAPNSVVRLLDRIFASFDELTCEYDVEKIKTIGDKYFAVAGLPDAADDHAERAALLALDLRETAKQFTREEGDPFQLRIGLHTGSLVAGVIGREKFSYDVWGHAVNVGSRMEETGVPGKIQVTPTTKLTLEIHSEHGFDFESRGTIEVKGTREMETFFLESVDRDGGAGGRGSKPEP